MTADGEDGGRVTIEQRRLAAVFGSPDFHDVEYGTRAAVSSDGTLVAALVHEMPDFGARGARQGGRGGVASHAGSTPGSRPEDEGADVALPDNGPP
ncbi:MAG: hypothetical protein IPH80_38300 [Myxococcales bacterium]|nr:hypothetical protein [Myxococcales bacterium]